ncbi:hypothetical protein F4819DRAFT_480898 [Hypoxylon fuscum]|nr:hypothetical protein F4819DRAFT_480898 [Hypoxylon fuscum]
MILQNALFWTQPSPIIYLPLLPLFCQTYSHGDKLNATGIKIKHGSLIVSCRMVFPYLVRVQYQVYNLQGDH